MGGSLRYTTRPADAAGRSWIGIDVTLRYLATLSGAEGVPAAKAVQVEASLYPRLWGRAGR